MVTLKSHIKSVIMCILLTLPLGGVGGGLYAQVPYGRSDNTTMFKDFTPAIIQMTTGKVVKAPKANIFLKNSHLVYKDIKGTDMEANMENIKSVVFNDRTFINNEGKLAEVVATVGDNKLLRTVYVDQEAMKNEVLNQSNITDISGLSSSSDVMGVTRLDVSDDEMRFPLIAVYTYVLNGKNVLCHEREVSRKIDKSKREIYNVVTRRTAFNWADENDLRTLLEELSK